MKQYIIFFSVLILSLVASSVARADFSTTIPTESPSLSRGVRPLGMGNAFIAMKGTDSNAPYYNPAAINDYSVKLHGEFLLPSVEFDPGAVSLATDFIDLANDIDGASDTNEMVDVFDRFLAQNSGRFESAHVRVPIAQMWNKYFFAGLLVDSRTTVALRQGRDPSVEVLSRNDGGLFIGSAYAFFDDQLQAGAAVKFLERAMFDRQITTADIITQDDFLDLLKSNGQWPYGFGVGFDLGLKWKVPSYADNAVLEYLKPTVGLTYQDIGNTRFSGPPMVKNTPQSLSLGLAVHPILAPGYESSFAMDFRELTNSSSFIKKFNVGYELRFPELAEFFNSSIRLGLGQGYFATGLTLDLRFFKIEFSTYGEEAGKFGHHQQNRRFALSLGAGF